MVSVTDTALPLVRPKAGRDDRLTLLFVLMIEAYLVISLALPLATMLWKSTEVRTFDYGAYTIEIDQGAGFRPLGTLADNQVALGLTDPVGQARRGTSLTAAQMFREGAFAAVPPVVKIRIKAEPGVVLEAFGKPVPPGDWVEAGGRDLRRIVLRAGTERSLANYASYFSTPALTVSIVNSLTVSLLTTVITVALAFGFAYALQRTAMPLKGLFRTVAMVPILVPSLLAGISLVYLFGNQGLLKGLLAGGSIYGAPGIVAGCVFFTFPHALLILTTALAISDARLFEAAKALRASPLRTFLTVTLPGARYGLRIVIIAAKARLAVSLSEDVVSSRSRRGVICQEKPQRSLHQPQALSAPPVPTMAAQ